MKSNKNNTKPFGLKLYNPKILLLKPTNVPTVCIKKSSNNLTYGEMPTTSEQPEMQTKKLFFSRLNKMGFQREKPEIQMSLLHFNFLSQRRN